VNEKNPISLTETTICIVGPQCMQNELLASFLAERTGATCYTGTSLEKPNFNGEDGVVVLWDCQSKTSKSVLGEIQRLAPQDRVMLLFNVNPDVNIEKEAVDLGVRGLIYEHENFDRLPKAVAAVSKGELWFSRRFMSKWILTTKRNSQFSMNGNGRYGLVGNGLSPKEVEILTLLSGGASNKEIADTLYISTNTAKTHVYNIFKKINVTSRFQAAIWAGKNL
jgi:DNA-binding NarL/FixJ family response regulator